MNYLHKFFWATVYIMGVTIVHHFYGALIYPLKFRIYTALFAVPVIGIEYLLYRYSKQSKIANILFQLLAIAIPIVVIGLFEGGYNHVVKNVLYWSGISKDTLLKLFPPPEYEMPDNFLFEFTGILQFILVIPAIFYLFNNYTNKTPRIVQ